MSMKIKVFNDRPYNIGVILLNNQHLNIQAGSFALLTEDDISYIESTCVYNKKLFGTGKLRIDKPEDKDIEGLGIYKAEENAHIPTDDVEKYLHGSLANLKKWLNTIDDKALLFEIYQVAKSLDLTTSKMKAISSAMPDSLIADLDD